MWTAIRHRVFAGTLFLSCLGQVGAQEPAVQPVSSGDDPPKRRIDSGYQLQDLDDPVMPMRPVVPRSAAIEARNDALSWFMIGRLFDGGHRNEPRRTLSAYRKAVKLDPQAIEIYRNLVPLEFVEDVEAAIGLATKAAELDPEDYEILQMLARHAAMSGQLPQAIKRLEQAINSPRVEKKSPQFRQR